MAKKLVVTNPPKPKDEPKNEFIKARDPKSIAAPELDVKADSGIIPAPTRKELRVRMLTMLFDLLIKPIINTVKILIGGIILIVVYTLYNILDLIHTILFLTSSGILLLLKRLYIVRSYLILLIIKDKE